MKSSVHFTELERREIGIVEPEIFISYSLFSAYKDNKIYFISAESSNDCSMAVVGGSRDQAEKIFRLLVEGKVTPCTLKDCVDDFLASEL